MPRTGRFSGLAILLVLAWVTESASAAFVAIANHTEREVRFAIQHAGSKSQNTTLAAGECRLVPVGRTPEIVIPGDGKESRFRLSPYSGYVFTSDGESVKVNRVEFAGAMPRIDDIPERPAAVAPLKFSVKLFVDNADVRAQAIWEKVLRERLAAASAVLERQVGVTFEVAEVGEWVSDPEAGDLEVLQRDFERLVKPGRATVVIGFTSRVLGMSEDKGVRLTCMAPNRTHILIHELVPRSEPERVEVLVHQLAHRLGAAHVPDPNSAMRPKLGDGKASSAKFRPGLDPLNVLAVGLWTDVLRTDPVKSWADLPPLTLSRLLIVYRTLQEISPDDPVVNENLQILERVRATRAAVNPGVSESRPTEVVPATPSRTAQQEAVRTVVRAIAVKASELNRQSAADRPKGDRFTTELIRTAAGSALTLDNQHQASAFLIGLGLGLDDSSVLRDNPLTRGICRAIESDDERRERIAVLGSPTVRHRRDLCQHYVVSAALTELLGVAAAESAGMTKELLDLSGDSGFSFADLAADFAGVALATKVKADPKLLSLIRDEFAIELYIPSIAGLAEGLTRQRFNSEYGNLDDPRFKQALELVRKRVAELPAFRK